MAGGMLDLGGSAIFNLTSRAMFPSSASYSLLHIRLVPVTSTSDLRQSYSIGRKGEKQTHPNWQFFWFERLSFICSMLFHATLQCPVS